MRLKYNAVDFGLHDNLIESIISLAKKYALNKLYIFGSRARGDFKERSDIDLAAIGGNIPLFSIDVEEETPTLLFFDVVDLEPIPKLFFMNRNRLSPNNNSAGELNKSKVID